ncbi:MAG: flagellar export protein FliJ [Paraperlucidibaca sp.]
MNRSQRLKPVVALAEREESQLAQAYTAQLQHLHVAREKLQQLVHYRLDYAVMAEQVPGRPMDLARLQGARAFLQRLSEAIGMQEAEICRLDGFVNKARASWLGAKRHQQSISDLVTRYHAQERQIDDKREQNRQDELSGQRMAWRLNAQVG